MAAVVGDRVSDGVGAVLTGLVVALEQLHVGVAHRLAGAIPYGSFDTRIRDESEGEVAAVEVRTDCDAGEEVAVLVETLRAVSAGAGGQRVFRRRQTGEGEATVHAGLHGLR